MALRAEWNAVKKNLRTMPTAKPFITEMNPPEDSPALITSAQATPSGYASSFSSIIRARRRGMEKMTPRSPPERVIISVGRNSKFVQAPTITRAGTVNITPAAMASPALAIVWTMLFSRIVPRRRTPLSMAMEITAAGMDADTVIPA